mmetsp:Transcript_31948/g.106644  ORF Transcript_31948/g.106644 Transcript_31948/m.106644 type:complete len:323 (+) Transcript_31948:274-1242(+)
MLRGLRRGGAMLRVKRPSLALRSPRAQRERQSWPALPWRRPCSRRSRRLRKFTSSLRRPRRGPRQRRRRRRGRPRCCPRGRSFGRSGSETSTTRSSRSRTSSRGWSGRCARSQTRWSGSRLWRRRRGRRPRMSCRQRSSQSASWRRSCGVSPSRQAAPGSERASSRCSATRLCCAPRRRRRRLSRRPCRSASASSEPSPTSPGPCGGYLADSRATRRRLGAELAGASSFASPSAFPACLPSALPSVSRLPARRPPLCIREEALDCALCAREGAFVPAHLCTRPRSRSRLPLRAGAISRLSGLGAAGVFLFDVVAHDSHRMRS